MRARAAALALLLAAPAAADIAPANSKRVDVSYSVTNLSAHPGFTLVAWPRACTSEGDPLGSIDLDMNPHLVARMNEMDYEVIRDAARHEIGKFCSGSARLYALPADEFPLKTAIAKDDDWMLGLEKDKPYAFVPAIDSLTQQERIPFFEKDPKVRRSRYRFSIIGYVRAPHPLKHAHDELEIEKIADTTLVIRPRRVIYTYDDGATETIDYQGDRRPPPSKPYRPLVDEPEPTEAPEEAPPAFDHPQPPAKTHIVDKESALRQRGRRPPTRTHVAGVAIAAIFAVGLATLLLARRRDG